MVAGTIGAGMIARKLARVPSHSDLRGRVEISPASLSVIALGQDFARTLCMNVTADWFTARANTGQ
jgi:hypothetical protein